MRGEKKRVESATVVTTHHGDHGGKPGMVARAARPEESIKDAADTREDIARRSA